MVGEHDPASTIVVFTRPVSVWPDHGELLDLLNPALAS